MNPPIVILLILLYVAIPLTTIEGLAETAQTKGAIESEAAVEAELRAAKRLVRAGQFEKAAKAYLALAARLPSHKFAEYAHYTAASLYHRQLKDAKRALELYQQLVATYPNDLTTGEAQVRIASILSELERYDEALKAYGKAVRMNVEYNKGAIVAEWVSRIDMSVQELITQISPDAPETQIRQLERFAEAAENGASWIAVGDRYRERGDMDGAARAYHRALSGRIDFPTLRYINQQLGAREDLAASLGFIRAWYLIGPFDGGTDMGVSTVHPPEGEIRLDAVYKGKTDSAQWQLYTTPDAFGEVNLREAVAEVTNAVAYAYCIVHAPLSIDAFLCLGTDDTNAVWFNGERLHAFNEGRGIVMDNDIVPLKLKAGDNTLLIKIGQGGGGWGFAARIVDGEGKVIQGIHTTPLPISKF